VSFLADTFYGIALTTPKDTPMGGNTIHGLASPQSVITTDEVLTEFLTNDKHFEQKSFRALFRHS
jgi:hypothetical protein